MYGIRAIILGLVAAVPLVQGAEQSGHAQSLYPGSISKSNAVSMARVTPAPTMNPGVRNSELTSAISSVMNRIHIRDPHSGVTHFVESLLDPLFSSIISHINKLEGLTPATSVVPALVAPTTTTTKPWDFSIAARQETESPDWQATRSWDFSIEARQETETPDWETRDWQATRSWDFSIEARQETETPDWQTRDRETRDWQATRTWSNAARQETETPDWQATRTWSNAARQETETPGWETRDWQATRTWIEARQETETPDWETRDWQATRTWIEARQETETPDWQTRDWETRDWQATRTWEISIEARQETETPDWETVDWETVDWETVDWATRTEWASRPTLPVMAAKAEPTTTFLKNAGHRIVSSSASNSTNQTATTSSTSRPTKAPPAVGGVAQTAAPMMGAVAVFIAGCVLVL